MASSRSTSPVCGASTRSASEASLRQPADQGATAGAPAHVVGADVPRDLQQPGAGRGVAPEASQRGQGAQVHLLGEVVGLGPVAQAGAHPPHLRLGAPHEGGRGHPIALARGQRQRGQVIHRPESDPPGTSHPSQATLRPCDATQIREALSARLDGEAAGLEDAVLDAHLDTCAELRGLVGGADGPAPHGAGARGRGRPRPHRGDPRRRSGRAGPSRRGANRAGERRPLGPVRGGAHAARARGARAAPRRGRRRHRPRRPRARVPSTWRWRSGSWSPRGSRPGRGGCSRWSRRSALVMGGTAVLDVVRGTATSLGEAHHLLDLAGVALLWLVAHEAQGAALAAVRARHRRESSPAPRWRPSRSASWSWRPGPLRPPRTRASISVDPPDGARLDESPDVVAPHLQRARLGGPRRRAGARLRRAARCRRGRPASTATWSRSTCRLTCPTAPTSSATGSCPRTATPCGGLRVRRGAPTHRRRARWASRDRIGGRPGVGGGPARSGAASPTPACSSPRGASRSSSSSTEAVPSAPSCGRSCGAPRWSARPRAWSPCPCRPPSARVRARASLFDDGVLAEVAQDGVGLGIVLALAGLVVAVSLVERQPAVALAGAVVAAGSFATNGHTRAGSSVALATIADVTHLLVVAAWGGGLVLLAALPPRPPARRGRPRRTRSRSWGGSRRWPRSRSSSSASPAPSSPGSRSGRSTPSRARATGGCCWSRSPSWPSSRRSAPTTTSGWCRRWHAGRPRPPSPSSGRRSASRSLALAVVVALTTRAGGGDAGARRLGGRGGGADRELGDAGSRAAHDRARPGGLQPDPPLPLRSRRPARRHRRDRHPRAQPPRRRARPHHARGASGPGPPTSSSTAPTSPSAAPGPSRCGPASTASPRRPAPSRSPLPAEPVTCCDAA